MTQIKKRININSFFRGGWATGWGCFDNPVAPRSSPPDPSRYVSRCSHLSCSHLPSLWFPFIPTFRPLPLFFFTLRVFFLFSLSLFLSLSPVYTPLTLPFISSPFSTFLPLAVAVLRSTSLASHRHASLLIFVSFNPFLYLLLRASICICKITGTRL